MEAVLQFKQTMMPINGSRKCRPPPGNWQDGLYDCRSSSLRWFTELIIYAKQRRHYLDYIRKAPIVPIWTTLFPFYHFRLEASFQKTTLRWETEKQRRAVPKPKSNSRYTSPESSSCKSKLQKPNLTYITLPSKYSRERWTPNANFLLIP